MILKILKWAYGDSLKYIGFLVAVFLAVAALEIFIFYTWAVILIAVVVCIVLPLFLFFNEL